MRLRQTFSLVDADVSEYEIVVNNLQAKEHKHAVSEQSLKDSSYGANHAVDMRVRWFETDDLEAKRAFLQKGEERMQLDEQDIVDLGY